MIKIYQEKNRGKGDFGWLKANYSFSFSNYYNPDRLGFKGLKVINEDFIKPDSGFPTHGHKNMEILTVVLSGELTHNDSLGNIAYLNPGKIQRMYAGSGIRHSEYNRSKKKDLNLLQIWIEPNQLNLDPEYKEKEFDYNKTGIQLLLSKNGRDGSIKYYGDAEVYLGLLEKGTHQLKLDNRSTYIHMISGVMDLEDELLAYGDSAEISNIHEVNLIVSEPVKFLIFKF